MNTSYGRINPLKSRKIDYPLARSGKSKMIPEERDVVMKIVSNFKDRSRKDIQKWRSALQQAEGTEKPSRDALQALYHDLLTDGHLIAQMRLRKYAVLNTDFSIRNAKTGKTNDLGTDLFNQRWFYEFLEHAIDRIFFGTTLVYFREFMDVRADLAMIPRENVVPERKMIIPDLRNREQGFRYDDPEYENWLMQLGADSELGLLNIIVPNLIWKRNVAQSWAEWCEKFGQPLITAETTSTDTKVIDNIEYLLTQLGEASQAVLPKGTTIDIKQPNQTDAYKVYQEFHRVNNDEIAEAIVGGTMITSDGSSRSQSEVHERNLDKKIATADRRDISFIVNDDLIPLLIAQGYTFLSIDDRLTFDEGHDLTLDKYWEIVEGVSADHEIDPEWISKTFGIPITGKKKSPVNNRPDITARLDGINWPDYDHGACCGTELDPVAAGDTFEKRIERHTEILLQQLWENESTLGSEARLMADEGLAFLDSLITGWGSNRVTAAFNAPDHLMLSMMELNVFRFAAGKNEARMAAMNELMLDYKKGRLKSEAEFFDAARQTGREFNSNWLRTERNSAIAVGQNSANYIRLMAEKDIMPYVEYQTIADSKVRPEHAVLDGKVFNLNDNDLGSLNPPNGYNCRCELVQLESKPVNRPIEKAKAAKAALGDKYAGSIWDLNRADLKQVFTSDQFYAGVPGKKINGLDFESVYKMPFSAEIRKSLSQKLKLDKSITGKNVGELFKGLKDGDRRVMPFRDYLQRSIILPEKAFKLHTKGKYLNEGRHQLFPAVKDILNSPDEVWLNQFGSKQQAQMRYIKHYANMTVVVDGDYKNGRLTLGTWYQLADKAEKKVRVGIRIKNSEGL